MRRNKLQLVLSVTLSVLAAVLFLVQGLRNVRWDKIPIIDFFVLEIELWPSGFDASYLSEPITWQQLDAEPADWEENGAGSWFSFNQYTKGLLKRYMQENHLGIVPDKWLDFKFTANFEECLETFDFVELDHPAQAEKADMEYLPLWGITVSGMAILSWLLWWRMSNSKRQTA